MDKVDQGAPFRSEYPRVSSGRSPFLHFLIMGLEKRGLFGAKAGEVLLVNRDRGGTTVTASAAVTASTTLTAPAATTTASTTATTGATATTAAGTVTTTAGGLDETHVDVKVVLFFALLGAFVGLVVVLLALDVFGLLIALQLLSVGPLVVSLGALVGGTDGLGAQVPLGSLLGQVVSEGLGLVRLLLLGRGLGSLVLIGVSDVLTGLLVVEFLLATLTAPAEVDLLARVAKFNIY